MRAVSLLGEYSSNATLGQVLTQVAKDISSGKSLHQALAEHPKTFSHIWLSLVEAGELGGQLVETLSQVALYTKTQEAMKSKIITAVTYPAILGISSVGVLRTLLTRGEAKYLGKPKVVTLNNQTATITASTDAAVGYTVTGGYDSSTPTTKTAERKNVGLT